MTLVQPLVALKADQRPPHGGGIGFGQLGLADAGGSFQQDRLMQYLA